MSCRLRTWLGVATVGLGAACGSKAGTRSAESAELLVGLDSVHVEVLARGWVRGVIPFRFVNGTRHLLGVGTGSGVHPPTVETWQAGVWTPTYSGVIDLSDGAPLLIRPGATYVDSVRIGGCLRGGACAPAWESDLGILEARLAWRLYRLSKPVRWSSELRGHDTLRVVSRSFRVIISRAR